MSTGLFIYYKFSTSRYASSRKIAIWYKIIFLAISFVFPLLNLDPVPIGIINDKVIGFDDTYAVLVLTGFSLVDAIIELKAQKKRKPRMHEDEDQL